MESNFVEKIKNRNLVFFLAFFAFLALVLCLFFLPASNASNESFLSSSFVYSNVSSSVNSSVVSQRFSRTALPVDSPALLPPCEDSDGGVNKFVKGYSKGVLLNGSFVSGVYDVCIDYSRKENLTRLAAFAEVESCSGFDCGVKDWRCFNGILGVDYSSRCPDGCNDGACKVSYSNFTSDSRKCLDMCGDGICQSRGCFEFSNCSCKEDLLTCPSDCNFFVDYYVGEGESCGRAPHRSVFCEKGLACKSSEGEDAGKNLYFGGICVPSDPSYVSKIKCGEIKNEFHCEARSDCEIRYLTTADCDSSYNEKGRCVSNKTSFVCVDKPIFSRYFRNYFVRCVDGRELNGGSSHSCKPMEVWREYAYKFCLEGNSFVDAFKPFNECSVELPEAVCGNGVCEPGEGEYCDVPKKTVDCKKGESCEVFLGKCSIVCLSDCKKGNVVKEVFFGEKFNLGVGQAALFYDQSLKDSGVDLGRNPLLRIEFEDVFVSRCKYSSVERKSAEETESSEKPVAKVKRYPRSLMGRAIFDEDLLSTKDKSVDVCFDKEVYANLHVSLPYSKLRGRDSERVQVVRIQLGEKKEIFGKTISFLDYSFGDNSGLFVVEDDGSSFDCPEGCVCDLKGNKIHCKIIKPCEKGKILCPDGVCKEKCEIADPISCEFGCVYKDKCLPYSVRMGDLYCDLSGSMNSQKRADDFCQNNFECESNVCVDGRCVSSNFLQQFLQWFRKFFKES